jgi:hypothetical protein
MPLLQYRKQPLGTYQKPSRVIGTAPVPTPANPRTPSGPFSRPAPQQPMMPPPQAPRFNVPNPIQAQPVNPGGSLFNGSQGPGATFGMPPPIQIGLNNVKPGDTQVQQPTGTLPGNDSNFGTQQQAMPPGVSIGFGMPPQTPPPDIVQQQDQGPQATFGMPAPLGQYNQQPQNLTPPGFSQAFTDWNNQQIQNALNDPTNFQFIANGGVAMPGAGAMGAPSLFNPGTLGQPSVL